MSTVPLWSKSALSHQSGSMQASLSSHHEARTAKSTKSTLPLPSKSHGFCIVILPNDMSSQSITSRPHAATPVLLDDRVKDIAGGGAAASARISTIATRTHCGSTPFPLDRFEPPSSSIPPRYRCAGSKFCKDTSMRNILHCCGLGRKT